MNQGVTARKNRLYGIGVVLRQQMRKARFRRDVVAAFGMLAGVAALAVALRYLVYDRLMIYDSGPAGMLRNWLSPCAMAATLLMMGAGAVCGAVAAPGAAAEEVQSSLLAGLPPLAVCSGRLIAGLRVPLAMVLMSALFWCLAQVGAQVVPEEIGGTGAILLAHAILICAVLMVGAFAFAFQAGARRRSWGGGVAAGLVLAAALVAAPFVVNTRVQTMEDPSRLLRVLLLFNPVFAVDSALGRDILHAGWIYAHTTAADYLLDYPSPLTSAGVFSIIGLAAFAIAAWRLRAAIRR